MLLHGLVGERSSYTANAMVAAAGARVRLGRVGEALAQLESGLAILEAAQAPGEELANARAELAIGLFAERVEPDRARALLALALAYFEAQDIDMPPQLERWLAEHPELVAELSRPAPGSTRADLR